MATATMFGFAKPVNHAPKAALLGEAEAIRRLAIAAARLDAAALDEADADRVITAWMASDRMLDALAMSRHAGERDLERMFDGINAVRRAMRPLWLRVHRDFHYLVPADADETLADDGPLA